MFPIPPERKLSIKEIADYWSRETRPQASNASLREEIVKAWWKGELSISSAPNRIDVLRGLYSTVRHDQVIFTAPGFDGPPMLDWRADGSVLVDMSVRVPLPNMLPELWTEENCAQALTVIADGWNEGIFHLLAPGLIGIPLSVEEFMTWVDQCEFRRPTFWRVAPPGRAKRITKKDASKFVRNYYEAELLAGRHPTMAGMERAAKEQGKQGRRDFMRPIFREVAGGATRGRPKNRAQKR